MEGKFENFLSTITNPLSSRLFHFTPKISILSGQNCSLSNVQSLDENGKIHAPTCATASWPVTPTSCLTEQTYFLANVLHATRTLSAFVPVKRTYVRRKSSWKPRNLLHWVALKTDFRGLIVNPRLSNNSQHFVSACLPSHRYHLATKCRQCRRVPCDPNHVRRNG